MNRRKPLGEVENAEKTWKAILDRFPQFKDLFPDIENLGKSQFKIWFSTQGPLIAMDGTAVNEPMIVKGCLNPS